MTNDYCLAHVSAVQLSAMVEEGAALEVFDMADSDEPVPRHRRALLDLTQPRLAAQFLDIVVRPAVRLSHAPRQQGGVAAPHKLLVFGFVHAEHEGLFVSHFTPYSQR